MELLVPGTFPLGDERRQHRRPPARGKGRGRRPRPGQAATPSLAPFPAGGPVRDFATLLEQGLLRIVV